MRLQDKINLRAWTVKKERITSGVRLQTLDSTLGTVGKLMG